MISRKLLEQGEEEKEDENSVEIVNEEDGQIIAFESKALDFINQQQYCGLVCLQCLTDLQKQNEDVTTPAVLKKGQSGIASCYENELFQALFILPNTTHSFDCVVDYYVTLIIVFLDNQGG